MPYLIGLNEADPSEGSVGPTIRSLHPCSSQRHLYLAYIYCHYGVMSVLYLACFRYCRHYEYAAGPVPLMKVTTPYNVTDLRNEVPVTTI
jgi:hypothetical protein